MPHSNSLLATGPATLFRKCGHILKIFPEYIYSFRLHPARRLFRLLFLCLQLLASRRLVFLYGSGGIIVNQQILSGGLALHQETECQQRANQKACPSFLILSPPSYLFPHSSLLCLPADRLVAFASFTQRKLRWLVQVLTSRLSSAHHLDLEGHMIEGVFVKPRPS
jgi:hypothetical protein